MGGPEPQFVSFCAPGSAFCHPHGQKWGDLRLWEGPGVLSRSIQSSGCPALELAPVRGVCAAACSAHSLQLDSCYPVCGLWA